MFLLCCLYGCKTQQTTTGTRFTADVQRDIPFRTSELRAVNKQTYSFKCDSYVTLLPDYEVDIDGASMVYRTTFMSAHDKQPANVIWRNIVINHKAKRVLCIDRFVQDGKTFGFVYFMQTETRQYSDEQTCHWGCERPSLNAQCKRCSRKYDILVGHTIAIDGEEMKIDTTNMCSHLQRKLFEANGKYRADDKLTTRKAKE